jgi:hypothetical protein
MRKWLTRVLAWPKFNTSQGVPMKTEYRFV